MTLLITVFSAIISTVIWYTNEKKRDLGIGVLCWLYWGAAIMWLADAIFEYAEIGAGYFTPKLEDMANDAYLGLSVVALGLIVWLIRLLLKDPRGVVKSALYKSSRSSRI